MTAYDLIFERYPWQDANGSIHVPHTQFHGSNMQPASGWWDLGHSWNDPKENDPEAEQQWRFVALQNTAIGLFVLENRDGYNCYLLAHSTNLSGIGGLTVVRHGRYHGPKRVVASWPYGDW